MRTGELGFWWRSIEGPPAARPALPGPIDVDVAIVGAGFTGLWSAYYLKRADPALRIAVLEAQTAGFGASGRNGGWVSGFFSGPSSAYERGSGRASLQALQRAMFETVDEIGAVLDQHAIDADFRKSGQLSVALNGAQEQRLREDVARHRELGLGEQDLRLIDRPQLAERLRIAGARSAAFSPHVARVHPAKLVRGLAELVERLGVPIYEGTPVRELRSGRAHTASGDVRARWVIRATEGYTPSLRGLRRALVPINSSMIITEPLPAAAWDEIGWNQAELLDDLAHLFVYLQRTADGRIAIGGRGVPYRFGSRTGGAGETPRATIESLRAKLLAMFPAVGSTPIDHAWSGVLGVARDWCVSVDAARGVRIASAGGYVGEGVAAANLAGRTLRDLLLDERSELTELPWVARRPRRWEPEPLRWCAIRGVYALYRQADRNERRGARPSRLGRLVDAAARRR